MDALFFLRSYGDFIVGLIALKNNKGPHLLNVYASKHLQPLYESLPDGSKPEVNMHFVDLGIHNAIMGCFTNRFLFSLTGVKELIALRRSVKSINNGGAIKTWYLEQYRRKFLPALFAGTHFESIHHHGNIYDSYRSFFKQSYYHAGDRTSKKEKQPVIIVFPDSRKAEKKLPLTLIDKISVSCEDRCICRIADFATFKGYESGNGNVHYAKDISPAEKKIVNEVSYHNFAELIALIQAADFIISADSLPAHLAQFLNKPHWILYNQKTNIEWITPYAQERGTYSCFHEFEKLALFLKGDSV